MNQRVTSIIEEARKLDKEELAELFERLEAEFLSDGTPEEIEAAWTEEVERRVERADRGETSAVDFDAAIARARRHLRVP